MNIYLSWRTLILLLVGVIITLSIVTWRESRPPKPYNNLCKEEEEFIRGECTDTEFMRDIGTRYITPRMPKVKV